MADRNLTEEEWGEFWRLPLEERLERCKSFSPHDSFRLRITDPGISANSPWIPCNDCIHQITMSPACKAYPDGPSAEHIRAVMADQSIECGNGCKFTPKE